MTLRLPALLAVATTLVLAASPAVAEVFKCATPTGKVEYRDYPCDAGAASGELVDTRANTIGTGESLASIRARDASMAQRLEARRAADEWAFERDRLARERAFYEDSAYRERQALADSLRYGNPDGAVYWPAYVPPHKHRRATPAPPPARVPPPAIVTRKKG